MALVSPDGVASSRMVDVSASVNIPLHHVLVDCADNVAVIATLINNAFSDFHRI